MTVTALNHVAVTVSDTARALGFYVDLIGLEQVEVHQLPPDSISTVFALPGASGMSTRLRVPGTEAPLIDLMEMYGRQGEGTPTTLGLVGACHIALSVDDLAATLDRLRAAGVGLLSEPVAFHLSTGEVTTVCFMKDPDGNYVELEQTERPG